MDAAWNDPLGPNGPSLSGLPFGLQTSLVGTRWDIRGIIQIGGTGPLSRGAAFPQSISIQIAQRCRRINFLHAAGWGGSPQAHVGDYIVHYADGKQVIVPLVFGGQYQRVV